tara:strand:- start:955 stop:1248 length:294 start_codon:yes stop_codon:yes gene_type:complete
MEMDNIKDDNLKRLGKHIAQALIEAAMEENGDEWKVDESRDHLVGELARCVTLQNLYLDREEYEKCAMMKLRIMDITNKLDIEGNFDPTKLEDDDEI